MPVKIIIYEKSGSEQAASRVQTKHLVYKTGIWCTKVAFRLQICTFQFTNKHLVLQTGVSDYNSAINYITLTNISLIVCFLNLYIGLHPLSIGVLRLLVFDLKSSNKV